MIDTGEAKIGAPKTHSGLRLEARPIRNNSHKPRKK